MKHWVAVVGVCFALAGMTWLRRVYQDAVVRWSAQRAGATRAQGRSRAWGVCGIACSGMIGLLAVAFWAWSLGGLGGYVRYPAALVVVLGYVPMAMSGAPKLTKWQKSYEQRLVDAGAAREAAQGWDAVARPFSAVAVLLGFGAVFLLVAPG